jgi:hypothetical protein
MFPERDAQIAHQVYAAWCLSVAKKRLHGGQSSQRGAAHLNARSVRSLFLRLLEIP